MSLLALIVSNDNYLGRNLSSIIAEEGVRNIRSADLERITREVKKPDRLTIVDVAWEPIQAPGVLKKLVNISRITGNKVICICPNQEEDLKKLAAQSRADEIFIRYDLETRFRVYIREIRLEAEKRESQES